MATLTHQLAELDDLKNQLERDIGQLLQKEKNLRARQLLQEICESQKRILELRKERLMLLAQNYDGGSRNILRFVKPFRGKFGA